MFPLIHQLRQGMECGKGRGLHLVTVLVQFGLGLHLYLPVTIVTNMISHHVQLCHLVCLCISVTLFSVQVVQSCLCFAEAIPCV